jgi:putative transposase
MIWLKPYPFEGSESTKKFRAVGQKFQRSEISFSKTMAIPTRATSHGTFFINTQTWNRQRLFQNREAAELFLETLQHYRREGHYKLHAFVVMPDHIHLLITPQIITLERAVQLIKGGFSRRLEAKFPVWQKGFTDRRMRDRADFLVHKNYIYENPVRACLCQRAEDFPYSSAYRQTHTSRVLHP